MSKLHPVVDIKAMHPEVTGSCILCTLRLPNREKVKFVVDCGLFQEDKYESLNEKLEFDPSELAFALVTHTHIDHIGRLPMLTKYGFSGKIYMSEIASKLAEPALYNTLQILTQNAQKPSNKEKNVQTIFDEDDYNDTLNLIQPVEFYKTFNVHRNIRVRFIKNPHILGAAMILVTVHYNGCPPLNIMFTGDYAKKNTFFATKKIAESLKNENITIVQESTYGATETIEVEKTFGSSISSAARKGYTVVIPVFAFERAQLIMLKLKQLQEKGKLNPMIPIYLDGELAIKYTGIYSDISHIFFKDVKDFYPENFHYVSSPAMRQALLSMQSQKIILTTSGMGSWGPAKTYLPYFVEKKKCLIQFTGYVSECSLGRKILEAKPGDEITLCDNNKVIKRAITKQTGEFSSHAKADELIEFDKLFLKPQAILINHGPTDTKRYFYDKVVEETTAKDVSILERNLIHRIGPYGLLKVFEDPN